MTMPAGSEVYSIDCAPVQARGRLINDDELSKAISGPVSSLLRDDVGKQELENLLVGVAETDFRTDGVRQVLHNDRAPEDWRVGEAFAEAYLCAQCRCMFPWPTSRDQKNPNASMPGTDLVGFQSTGDEVRPMRFAFGEVKTSSEAKYPPSLVYGQHGFRQQLEDLRGYQTTRNALMMYLGFHADGKPWQPQYQHAARRYFADSTDVAIFGVLVRDVKPDSADLRACADALAIDPPPAMRIELYAIYLPSGCVSGIGKRVRLKLEGDHARN